jgi:hypothetical protein
VSELGIVRNALFHDKRGDSEVRVEPLSHRHAACFAQRCRLFGQRKRPGWSEARVFNQDLKDVLPKRFEFAGSVIWGTLQVFSGFRVMQGQEQIDTIPTPQPLTHRISLRGNLGHLDRIDDIPISIQIEAVAVEADPAARNTIRIA